jgi:diadenosine tetraphosphate (Ap4A) HIT family hydrolase
MVQSPDSEAGFSLDPRLATDCLTITDLALSRILLMNDSRFPWLILVPRRRDMREIHHLTSQDLTTLFSEITRISELLEAEFSPTKINIGALGNIVSQLHIHIIARNEGDAAWPGPVWGHGPAIAYAAEEGEKLVQNIAVKLT